MINLQSVGKDPQLPTPKEPNWKEAKPEQWQRVTFYMDNYHGLTESYCVLDIQF